MTERPLSITIIAWLLIVMAGISLFFSLMSMNDPEVTELMSQNALPVSVQYGVLYLEILINLTAGAAMLKARNWGRFLYVGWGLIGFLIAAIATPAKLGLLPGLVFFAVIVFFLFRPIANEYFGWSPGGR
ncbi:MAG: hypothetical protein KGY54_10550 [Oleiphilaceae bacterium]|nr:hypothetical protein [Oleiphilaceae bacterium]